MKPWYTILAVRSLSDNQEHMATLLKPRMLNIYINIRHVRGMAPAGAVLSALSILFTSSSDIADMYNLTTHERQQIWNQRQRVSVL